MTVLATWARQGLGQPPDDEGEAERLNTYLISRRDVCFQPFHGVIHVRDDILVKILAVDYMGLGFPSESNAGDCGVKIESCGFSGEHQDARVLHE